jgi:hypothetical protein
VANQTPVDFIARLAEAWDGRGDHVLSPPHEHLALLALADEPNSRLFPHLPWRSLPEDVRRKLVFAARKAVDLGRACAWVFGEGEGA